MKLLQLHSFSIGVVIVVYSSHITYTRQCRIQVYNCVLFSFPKLFLCTFHWQIFVCLFFVVRKKISLIWRHHHYCCRAKNFDLYSGLMAIEQWRFFNMSHRPTRYKGHFKGPLTLTPFAERLSVELHYLF